MQLSNVRTLRLKHGRVVIDVLNEDCYWQVRAAAVSSLTRQTEPKQILSHYLQYFIVRRRRRILALVDGVAVDLMYVVMKARNTKQARFFWAGSGDKLQICWEQHKEWGEATF